MVLGQRCTCGSHNLADASLMARHHIQVTLNDYHVSGTANRLLGKMQPEDLTTLVI